VTVDVHLPWRIPYDIRALCVWKHLNLVLAITRWSLLVLSTTVVPILTFCGCFSCFISNHRYAISWLPVAALHTVLRVVYIFSHLLDYPVVDVTSLPPLWPTWQPVMFLPCFTCDDAMHSIPAVAMGTLYWHIRAILWRLEVPWHAWPRWLPPVFIVGYWLLNLTDAIALYAGGDIHDIDAVIGEHNCCWPAPSVRLIDTWQHCQCLYFL